MLKFDFIYVVFWQLLVQNLSGSKWLIHINTSSKNNIVFWFLWSCDKKTTKSLGRFGFPFGDKCCKRKKSSEIGVKIERIEKLVFMVPILHWYRSITYFCVLVRTKLIWKSVWLQNKIQIIFLRIYKNHEFSKILSLAVYLLMSAGCIFCGYIVVIRTWQFITL